MWGILKVTNQKVHQAARVINRTNLQAQKLKSSNHTNQIHHQQNIIHQAKVIQLQVVITIITNNQTQQATTTDNTDYLYPILMYLAPFLLTKNINNGYGRGGNLGFGGLIGIIVIIIIIIAIIKGKGK